MDVQEMYKDFRSHYPEVVKAADTKHAAIWGGVEHPVNSLWFESLASVINDRMGNSEHRSEIAAVLSYFDVIVRTGGKEVKDCIDVGLVENLFWDVAPTNVAPIWAALPKTLQKLYLDFHGRPPGQI